MYLIDLNVLSLIPAMPGAMAMHSVNKLKITLQEFKNNAHKV